MATNTRLSKESSPAAFPIYPVDPSEPNSIGKTRQIQYKLHAGEAGWLLKVDKVVEF